MASSSNFASPSISILAVLRDALNNDTRRQELRHAVVQLWRIAIPASFTNMLWKVSQWIITMYTGHRLGSANLEALAAGSTVYNVSAFSLGIGFLCALDTLASQAFGRNPKSPEMGELLQRALFLVILFALPCFIFFYYSEYILSQIFSESLARGASLFLKHANWLLLGQLVNGALSSVVGCARLTHIPIYGWLVNSAVVWVLAQQYLRDSISSAVFILTVGIWVNNLVLIGFTIRHPALEGIRSAGWALSTPNKGQPAPESPSLNANAESGGSPTGSPLLQVRDPQSILDTLSDVKAIKEFLAIGIPTMVGVCADWWAFEILVMFAGRIGDAAVGLMAIVFGCMMLCFVIPAGLVKGTTICIGNALGAGNPALALLSAAAGMMSVFIAQLFVSLALYLFHDTIFQWWTLDEELLAAATRALPILIAGTVLDACGATLQGIFRGVGQQSVAAKRVLLALWGVGVTSAFALGFFTSLGAIGVLLGNLLGLLVELPLLLHGTWGWDWNKLSEVASKHSIAPMVDLGEGDNRDGQQSDIDAICALTTSAQACDLQPVLSARTVHLLEDTVTLEIQQPLP